MPDFHFIKPFELMGKVESVRIAALPGTHITAEVSQLDVSIESGILHDNHAGKRLADVREKDLLALGIPKRTEIANHRQFSAISVEEMHQVALLMGIPNIPEGFLGENLIVSGIPDFTLLPPGTKLFFKRRNFIQRAVLLVFGENMPCSIPGNAIQQAYPDVPNLKALFIKKAVYKRGIVGSVYCAGHIKKGDTVIAKIPRQYIYEVL